MKVILTVGLKHKKNHQQIYGHTSNFFAVKALSEG